MLIAEIRFEGFVSGDPLCLVFRGDRVPQPYFERIELFCLTRKLLGHRFFVWRVVTHFGSFGLEGRINFVPNVKHERVLPENRKLRVPLLEVRKLSADSQYALLIVGHFAVCNW